jgi:hypothetical protein
MVATDFGTAMVPSAAKFKESRLAPDHDVATLRSDGTSLSIALPIVFLKFLDSYLAADGNVATSRSAAKLDSLNFKNIIGDEVESDSNVAT